MTMTLNGVFMLMGTKSLATRCSKVNMRPSSWYNALLVNIQKHLAENHGRKTAGLEHTAELGFETFNANEHCYSERWRGGVGGAFFPKQKIFALYFLHQRPIRCLWILTRRAWWRPPPPLLNSLPREVHFPSSQLLFRRLLKQGFYCLGFLIEFLFLYFIQFYDSL